MINILTFVIIIFVATSVEACVNKICDEYLQSKEPKTTLEKLANESTPKSDFCIAAMYHEGVGVNKNISKSIFWLRKSADKNYPPAQANLGGHYFNGEGVPKNEKKAFFWLKKSADGGLVRGQYYTGWLYVNGIGTEKNIAEGIKWLKKSKIKNYILANKILDHFPKSIEWKITTNTLKAWVLLIDRNGIYYPNDTALKEKIDKNNYMAVKLNDHFYVSIYYDGCELDENNKCNELVDIDIFNSEWSLISKIDDAKLDQLAYNKSVASNGIVVNDRSIQISLENKDVLGKYHIFVSILNSEKKIKFVLNQVFWVIK